MLRTDFTRITERKTRNSVIQEDLRSTGRSGCKVRHLVWILSTRDLLSIRTFHAAIRPALSVRRNHPNDLSRGLLRILRHLTGELKHIANGEVLKSSVDYLEGDTIAREKLELSILSAVTLVVEVNGELVLVDDTDGARFAPIWFAVLLYWIKD